MLRQYYLSRQVEISGLSWSDINEVEEEHLLRLDRMAAIDVRPDLKRVRVQGGALMSDIQEALENQNLALDRSGRLFKTDAIELGS